jgi:hypothetical protein
MYLYHTDVQQTTNRSMDLLPIYDQGINSSKLIGRSYTTFKAHCQFCFLLWAMNALHEYIHTYPNTHVKIFIFSYCFQAVAYACMHSLSLGEEILYFSGNH